MRPLPATARELPASSTDHAERARALLADAVELTAHGANHTGLSQRNVLAPHADPPTFSAPPNTVPPTLRHRGEATRPLADIASTGPPPGRRGREVLLVEARAELDHRRHAHRACAAQPDITPLWLGWVRRAGRLVEEQRSWVERLEGGRDEH
jgi:hypothetical protein